MVIYYVFKNLQHLFIQKYFVIFNNYIVFPHVFFEGIKREKEIERDGQKLGLCCRRKGNNSVDNGEILKILQQDYAMCMLLKKINLGVL